MKITSARKGLTLIELVVTIVISIIPILATGMILASNERFSKKTWSSIHNEMRDDAQKFTILFGLAGRNANRLEYRLYEVENSSFDLAVPRDDTGQNVEGDAVEFIYWEEDLNRDNVENLMDTSVRGTRYALFYSEEGKLKVDYGDYPPRGIINGSKREPDRTEVIVRNLERVIFSHKTESGIGKGCVRATVTISNPQTDETMTIKVATLLRNIWPR